MDTGSIPVGDTIHTSSQFNWIKQWGANPQIQVQVLQRMPSGRREAWSPQRSHKPPMQVRFLLLQPFIGVQPSLVGRVVWDHEAAGSSPVTPTIHTGRQQRWSMRWTENPQMSVRYRLFPPYLILNHDIGDQYNGQYSRLITDRRKFNSSIADQYLWCLQCNGQHTRLWLLRYRFDSCQSPHTGRIRITGVHLSYKEKEVVRFHYPPPYGMDPWPNGQGSRLISERMLVRFQSGPPFKAQSFDMACVPKWSKGEDCKSSIHRFESCHMLHTYALLV